MDDNIPTIVKTICDNIHNKTKKKKLVTEDPYNAVKDRIAELFPGGTSEILWKYLPYFEGKEMNDNEIKGFYEKLGIDLSSTSKNSKKNTKKIKTKEEKRKGKKMKGGIGANVISELSGVMEKGQMNNGGNDPMKMLASSAGLGDNELTKQSFIDSIKIICEYINDNPTTIMPLIESFNKDFKIYLNTKLDKNEFINIIKPFSKQFIQKLKNKSISKVDIKDVFEISEPELLEKRYNIPLSYFEKYIKNIDNNKKTEGEVSKKTIQKELEERKTEVNQSIENIKTDIKNKEEEKNKMSSWNSEHRPKIRNLKKEITDLQNKKYELEREQKQLNEVDFLINKKRDELCYRLGKSLKESIKHATDGTLSAAVGDNNENCNNAALQNKTKEKFIKEILLSAQQIDALSKNVGISRNGGKKSYKQKKYKSNRRKTIKYKKTHL
jgi:hypothetical protein